MKIENGRQVAARCSSKVIPTFLIYYGGGPSLVSADAPKLAKFDIIDIDRFRYYGTATDRYPGPRQ